MSSTDPTPADVAELYGGPLDGQTITLTGWTADQRAEGAALISPRSAYGPGGRSLYGPDPDDPSRWLWEGDTP